MREIGSFLGWLLALAGSVLALSLATKLLSLPVDLGVAVTFLPLVAAFAILERGDRENVVRKTLTYMVWFLGGIAAIVLTASVLALVQ